MTIQYIQNNLKNNNSITYTISEKKSSIDGSWGCHLIGNNLKGYITIMRHYYLEIVLQKSVSDSLRKKKNDTKTSIFTNSYIPKKVPLNPV
ncbi:hypothetical protein C6497_16060 [Candidatus Poribacteria bacterium]|nr:MAG: hypothetical protein C6497_16060 [Candidatus Poribacteria bacterium]